MFPLENGEASSADLLDHGHPLHTTAVQVARPLGPRDLLALAVEEVKCGTGFPCAVFGSCSSFQDLARCLVHEHQDGEEHCAQSWHLPTSMSHLISFRLKILFRAGQYKQYNYSSIITHLSLRTSFSILVSVKMWFIFLKPKHCIKFWRKVGLIRKVQSDQQEYHIFGDQPLVLKCG